MRRKLTTPLLLIFQLPLSVLVSVFGICGWQEISCAEINCYDCEECFESVCPTADTIILILGITGFLVGLYFIVKIRKATKNKTP